MATKKTALNVIVQTVPHPDPEGALNLVAEIALKQLLKEGLLSEIPSSSTARD